MGTDTELTAIRARLKKFRDRDYAEFSWNQTIKDLSLLLDLADLVEQQREEIERLDDLADARLTKAQVAEADRDRLAAALEAVRKLPEQWEALARVQRQSAGSVLASISADINGLRAKELRTALLSPEGRRGEGEGEA